MTPTDPRHGAGHQGHGDVLNNPEVTHEHSDVDVAAILGFAGATAVIAIVSAVAMWGMFILLENQAQARDPEPSPVAVPATPLPLSSNDQPAFAVGPEPRLLIREPEVLQELRTSEDQRLHRYGWVDQNGGVAHLPIEEAKKLIVERGLASRATAVGPALGTHAPAFGEANGGRTIPTGEPRPAGAAGTGAAGSETPGATPAPEGTGAVHQGQAAAPAEPGAKKEGSGS
jgi:hypothetical protein